MSTPTALLLLAEGFEELEAVAPLDILRRAGVAVTTAALGGERTVTGKHGIALQADTLFREARGQTFDAVVLPGGPGHKHLRKDNDVIALLKHHYEAGRLVGAICAAPTVLKDAGLLVDRRYTAHQSVLDELDGAVTDTAVVIDGPLITSRGAGTAIEFGLALAGELAGAAKAHEVGESIHHHPAGALH